VQIEHCAFAPVVRIKNVKRTTKAKIYFLLVHIMQNYIAMPDEKEKAVKIYLQFRRL